MPEPYRHTQIGYVPLIYHGLMLFFMAGWSFYIFRSSPQMLILTLTWFLLVLGLVMLVYSALTIEVRNGEVHARFGIPAFFGPTIQLNKIIVCKSVRVPWYLAYGWRRRWYRSDWDCSISGLQAVEIKLKDGTTVRLGSDEPEALCAAIRAHLGQG